MKLDKKNKIKKAKKKPELTYKVIRFLKMVKQMKKCMHVPYL